MLMDSKTVVFYNIHFCRCHSLNWLCRLNYFLDHFILSHLMYKLFELFVHPPFLSNEYLNLSFQIETFYSFLFHQIISQFSSIEPIDITLFVRILRVILLAQTANLIFIK